MRDEFTFFGGYFLLLVSLLVNLEKRVITWDERGTEIMSWGVMRSSQYDAASSALMVMNNVKGASMSSRTEMDTFM